MEVERGFTRSIIVELHFLDIVGDQMKGESGVIRSFIDELRCSSIQGDQLVVKVMLLQVSLMNFILRICEEIKFQVKVVLLEV